MLGYHPDIPVKPNKALNDLEKCWLVPGYSTPAYGVGCDAYSGL